MPITSQLLAKFLSAPRIHTRQILQRPHLFKWSLQGFGMLRLHLDDTYRLNVWDSRYRTPNVSLMHTHPWDFESKILSGKLVNRRFRPVGNEAGVPAEIRGLVLYKWAFIKPGPDGGMSGDSGGAVWLHNLSTEVYTTGQIYSQRAQEIHISDPADGTVTFNKRTRVGDDIAKVFWLPTTDWVDAKPRKATAQEVEDICTRALATYDE